MRSYTFIVNPAAGKGAGARIAARLERLLESWEADHNIVLTEGPGHATELARQAVGNVVVSVGGDGTVNEIVNGLLGTGKALAIVPAGSGNDFVKSVSIPRKLEASIAKCYTGNIIDVDVGTVICGPEESPRRLFLNGIGIGFDASVAVRTRKIRYLRGLPLYLLAVFQTLRSYTNPQMHIDLDGRISDGRRLLVAIGNGTCAGGGFYLTPEALVDDGLLDFCLIGDARIGRILRLMPLVIWGKHLSRKDIVTYSKGRMLHMRSEEPVYVHADGEIVGELVREVRIGLEGRKLPVVA